MSTPAQKTVAVVVGGSLVGLSAALFLAARKVPVVLIERHEGSSPHPRAIGFTTRTIELFRSVGIESKVLTSGSGKVHGRPRRVQVDSLTGKWHDEKMWTKPQQQGQKGPPPENTISFTPCGDTGIAQDHLEPILRERALELGATLRLGCKMTRFSQDDKGVTVTATDSKGQEFTVQADYLIGCDGAKSPIREALGIETGGVGHLRTLRSILFKCPSIESYLERGFRRSWAFMWNDESNERLSAEKQKSMLIKAIGQNMEDIELLTEGQWELRGEVADSFSSGKVFLAGDAAHTLPPSRGGWGANTGISDTHNLAWKIDSVMRGVSSPAILDTYTTERRAVALLRHDQIFIRDDYKDYVRGSAWEIQQRDQASPVIYGDIPMELGQIYKSSAIVLGVADPNALPEAQRPDEWAGQPGTRAPHLSLKQNEHTISTLDLFCNGWVLLSESGEWKSAVSEACQRLGHGIECSFFHVGEDFSIVDGNQKFDDAFGVSTSGATLIRPDGYVAWRAKTKPDSPTLSFVEALATAAQVRRN